MMVRRMMATSSRNSGPMVASAASASNLSLVSSSTLVVNFGSGCEGEFEAGEVAGAGSVEWVSVPPGVEPDEVECGGGEHVFEMGFV